MLINLPNLGSKAKSAGVTLQNSYVWISVIIANELLDAQFPFDVVKSLMMLGFPSEKDVVVAIFSLSILNGH